MVYPPPPAKGGISVTNEDLHCLNDGEFLNDVIIDFYLKSVSYFSVGIECIISEFDHDMILKLTPLR